MTFNEHINSSRNKSSNKDDAHVLRDYLDEYNNNKVHPAKIMNSSYKTRYLVQPYL